MKETGIPDRARTDPAAGAHRFSPWRFARGVTAGVLEHQSLGSAAQIAYFLLFATFPFLLTLASLLAFLPIPNLMGWLLGLLGAIVPSAAVSN